jgi:hypothetical protein
MCATWVITYLSSVWLVVRAIGTSLGTRSRHVACACGLYSRACFPVGGRRRRARARDRTGPHPGGDNTVAELGDGPSLVEFAATFVETFAIVGGCMSVCLHRYFSHQAFKTGRAMQALLCVGGC